MSNKAAKSKRRPGDAKKKVTVSKNSFEKAIDEFEANLHFYCIELCEIWYYVREEDLRFNRNYLKLFEEKNKSIAEYRQLIMRNYKKIRSYQKDKKKTKVTGKEISILKKNWQIGNDSDLRTKIPKTIKFLMQYISGNICQIIRMNGHNKYRNWACKQIADALDDYAYFISAWIAIETRKKMFYIVKEQRKEYERIREEVKKKGSYDLSKHLLRKSRLDFQLSYLTYIPRVFGDMIRYNNVFRRYVINVTGKPNRSQLKKDMEFLGTVQEKQGGYYNPEYDY